jgi:hypothetical protein
MRSSPSYGDDKPQKREANIPHQKEKICHQFVVAERRIEDLKAEDSVDRGGHTPARLCWPKHLDESRMARAFESYFLGAKAEPVLCLFRA